MSTKVQNYLEEKLAWRSSSDPHYPYDAEFDGERCVLRLNDFPGDHLYTLLVDYVEVTSFDDWPEQWKRPQSPPKNVNHAELCSKKEFKPPWFTLPEIKAKSKCVYHPGQEASRKAA